MSADPSLQTSLLYLTLLYLAYLIYEGLTRQTRDRRDALILRPALSSLLFRAEYSSKIIIIVVIIDIGSRVSYSDNVNG